MLPPVVGEIVLNYHYFTAALLGLASVVASPLALADCPRLAGNFEWNVDPNQCVLMRVENAPDHHDVIANLCNGACRPSLIATERNAGVLALSAATPREILSAAARSTDAPHSGIEISQTGCTYQVRSYFNYGTDTGRTSATFERNTLPIQAPDAEHPTPTSPQLTVTSNAYAVEVSSFDREFFQFPIRQLAGREPQRQVSRMGRDERGNLTVWATSEVYYGRSLFTPPQKQFVQFRCTFMRKRPNVY